MKVFIECEQGSRIKLEHRDGCMYPSDLCGHEKELVLDRILDIPFPANYGYVVDSEVQPDGDLQDAFVVHDEWDKFSPGQIVEAEPVLCIEFEDNGIRDDKLVFGSRAEWILPLLVSFLESYKPGCRVLGIKRQEEPFTLFTGEYDESYGG